jgi:hypothetical protein
MELSSPELVRPGSNISGCGVPEGGGTAFRRPVVTVGRVGSWVEIDNTGGSLLGSRVLGSAVLGSRTLGTPVICENRVAGGFEVDGAGDCWRNGPLEKLRFSSSASKEFARGRDEPAGMGGSSP